MADFTLALPLMLLHEGGYAYKPGTGETVNRGITHWLLRAIGVLWDPPKDIATDGERARLAQLNPGASAERLARDYEITFVKSLTLDETGNIYRKHFWDALSLEQVIGQGVAAKVFDLGVNTGLQQAVKFLQRAINALSALAPLVVDGSLGPATLARTNAVNGEQLLFGIKQQARAFYRDLAQAHPEMQGNLAGWLARVDS